ncbi:MFS transporter [bacterium 210820-DFI.6.37]|nr:MFS transporter [bacterium 210820-DFI.6.37]
MSERKNNSKIKWLYLILGAIALLFGGIIYSWSILKSPLAEAFGWNATQLAFNYTLTICLFVLGGLFSGMLSKKTTPRIRLFLSAALVFFGFFLSSRVEADSLWLLYLAYGGMAGLGIGFLYNTTLSVVSEWFPDKSGLCSGIMLTCFGFSTLIFGGLAGKLMAMPDFGWRTTYFLLGTVMAVVVLILGLVLKRPEEPVLMKSEKKKLSAVIPGAGEFTAAEMLKRISFWKVAIAFTLFGSIGNVAISCAKDFAIEAGAGETFAITMAGMLSVCNGIGRICAGAVYDSLALRKTQYVVCSFAIIAPLCGILAVITGAYLLAMSALLLCGFSYGLCPTSTAIYPKLFYGEKNYALNFSIMNLTLIPAAFIATLAGAIITGTGSYLPVFAMLTAFGAAGSIILLNTRKA